MSEIRSRKWFLTINKESESYSKFEDIIRQLERCKYCYVLHDRDNEEQPHYHIALSYDNARSFSSMRKLFVGAHVEECKYWNVTIRYLLHLDDENKFQYTLADIGTNIDIELLEQYLNTDEFTYLSTEDILEAIITNEVFDITSAIRRWGLNQVSHKINIIKALIQENQQNVDSNYELAALRRENEELRREMKYYRDLYGYKYELEKGVYNE